ncbi:lamin tail domain-containing protein [bacterium]|nr:lamin tail domain-containing protein [bacterium]
MRGFVAVAGAVLLVSLAGAQIVVNEIMFNPPGTVEEEWVELYNYSDTDVYLDSTWYITDGEGEYHFEGYLLEAEGFMTLLFYRPDSGEIHIVPDIDATGHGIHLANSADDVILIHATESDTMVIDSVTYSGDWAPDANNTGYSMERIHIFGDSNDPSNWGASTVMWGTPDALNSISEIKESSSLPAQVRISAYPNPFNSACVVEVGGGRMQIQIRSADGRLVDSRTITGGKFVWKPEKLPGGVYIISAEGEGTSAETTVLFIK